ncbi:MAG: WecB/TagA/CpsF family glycosyltransferase, partial [Clostridia bacterium]|nr:WecB/TagA/CpsF family glycosyltransferase [Clostridia bacterium]
IPDGIGIYLASLVSGSRLPERSTGIDTAEQILKIAEKQNLHVFLLGGKKGVAKKAALALKKRYPRLIICGIHHGYFDKDKDCRDNGSVIRSINAAKADILFVCFGFPLQERWIAENLPSLPSVRLAMGLGGSLDVWSGNIRRAPSWVQSIGLEWLWRATLEPRRYKSLKHIPTLFVCVMKEKKGCRS